ncbi:nucleotide excision repair endonuclease [Bacillus pseudomycoides]|uniref:Nucleotide excision repair endonuclease n=1 Tax=Bacillus pseudomycoides TaxID=64104 RepID=A0AA91ZTQ9_9BACI|nr:MULTISPECIES: GIY-YIG nuclease family protein [Bacillus]PEB50777.1 nucleotide excision repair endonuclease [Bacillus sp. AFS098217]PED83020.1 nucleotide excision repair endonuclease [Bacillus pseudomycoides]PEU06207.1 nucleotide excision repair endonuclease [Bacillus sp. AFS019443]PEU20158.1 nucleotide excision repair endonuclease [Bacillus sp. AFS014408]PFW62469.1 nucleotide excision repair endonuclease [Bacillus sp. AFS075034]
MITIKAPRPDIIITKQKDPELSNMYEFTDFHLIPRDKDGIFMFYNNKNELMFVGKARKLRPRIKKHFEDTVSVIKDHRGEVIKIDVCLVENAMEREIYETYIANKQKSKYNVDKVFFK